MNERGSIVSGAVATFRTPPAMVATGLALLPLILFIKPVLGLTSFYHHDLQFYFFPYHKVAADIIKSGHLPLWNPYPFGGMPLIGDGQTALFYPLNWLYLLLNAAHAMSLGIVLNFSVAAVGMFLFARRLRLGLPAAAVASIAFAFNGFLVARMGHPSIMAGASLIPLIFWAADRLIEVRDARALIVMAVVVAFQLVSGHPQIPVYTGMALAIYVLVVVIGGAKPQAAVWVAGAYLLAFGLSAIQLLPWFELIQRSPRAAAATYDFLTADSVTGIGWLLMLFPYLLGGMRETFLQNGYGWNIPVYSGERLGYIGILPLMLAIYAVATIIRRRSFKGDARLWALVIIAAVMLLAAAGSGTPFGRLIYIIPMAGKLRCYARFMGVAAFALAILAGVGVEFLPAVARGVWRALPAIIGGAVALVTLICLSLAQHIQFESKYAHLQSVNEALHASFSFAHPNGYVPLILAGVSVAVLVFACARMSRGVLIAIVAIALVDCASFAWSFCPTKDSSVFAHVPPSVEFLKKQTEPYRVAVFLASDHIGPEDAQRQLAVSWALPYGIEDVNGFNSLQPRRHMDFLFSPDAPDISYGALVDSSLLHKPSNRLNLLDAQFAVVPKKLPIETGNWWRNVYADDAVTIYQNPAPYSRAFFAKQVVTGLSDLMTLRLVWSNEFPSNRIVTVERMRDDVSAALTIPDPADPKLIRRSPDDVQLVPPTASYSPYDPPASVTFTHRSPNRIDFETTSVKPRLLVLSEMDFPGWHAQMIAPDGSIDPLEIFRANYLFRGLTVPEGQNTKFQMFYRPSWFYTGALLTLVCAAGSAVTWFAPTMPRVARVRDDLREWFATRIVRPQPALLDADDDRRWLPTSLLALTAIFLGIAIQLRDGLITPTGIGLLACACASGVAAMCVPATMRRVWSFRWPRPDLLILGLAVPIYFALMFGMIPGAYMQLGAFETFRPFPIILSLAAVIAGTALADRPLLGRATVPALVALHLILGAWVIYRSPSPTIDVFLFQRDAAEAVLNGRNPYAMTYRNIYGPGSEWLYAPGIVKDGRLLFGYPYMPLTLLFTTPAHFFFNDYRYGQLIAMGLAGLLLAFARPGRVSMLAAVLLLFSPRSFFAIEQGWTEPIVFLLLAATVFCAHQLPRALPYALGLFLVSKQYMPAAAALVPLLIPRERWTSWDAWKPIVWRAVLAGAIVTLPFILINPAAFWNSAVALQFKQPFRFDSLSFLAALSEVKYELNKPPTGTPPPGAAAIAFVALIVGIALALWRLKPSSPRSFAAGIMLTFLLFFAFNKQAFANYYFLVIAAAWTAVAAGGGEYNREGAKGAKNGREEMH